jgi:hypothetical protein
MCSRAPSLRDAAVRGATNMLPSRSSRSIRVMPIARPIMLTSVNATVATTPHTIAPSQLIAPQPSTMTPATMRASGGAMLSISPSGPHTLECLACARGVPATNAMPLTLSVRHLAT